MEDYTRLESFTNIVAGYWRGIMNKKMIDDALKHIAELALYGNSLILIVIRKYFVSTALRAWKRTIYRIQIV